MKDPEGNETTVLLEMVDFQDLNVLEIGCGDGRLTWCFAEKTSKVTVIDPSLELIEQARDNLPDALRKQVKFIHTSIEDFQPSIITSQFDGAIFSWSL
jgi:ubiquinone/menaquinone biosynthesis C-methylase UbiE